MRRRLSLAETTRRAEGTARVAGYFRKNLDDDDYYSLELAAGVILNIDMSGPTDKGQDFDLYLFGSNGTRLAKFTADGTAEHVSYQNANQTKSKTIFILVTSYRGFSTGIPYTLKLSRSN